MSRIKIYFAVALVSALTLTVILFNQGSSVWTIEKFKSQKLDWQNCYDNFECSTFKVPVNYEKIDSEVFTLKVLRHSAADQDRKLGAIIVNPGGPGGSATDYAYNAESIVSKEINDRYDIIGFDPRGINNSQPIRCLTNSEEDEFLDAGTTRNNAAEIADLVAISKSFAEKCAKAAGSKLGHYSTLETAKDLEILRILLGEPKLNYLGKSYGTYLGTIYAALYPNSVGRFVLDGAVAPKISLRDQELAQAIGFGEALNNYLASQKKYTIGDITKFIKQSEVNPLTDVNSRKATQSLIVTAIAQSLYNQSSGWPQLTSALNQAILKKNPEKILELADQYNSRDSSGNYYSNQNDISIMITCLDWQEQRSVEDMSKDQVAFAQKSPVFGPYLSFAGLPCKYWKAEPKLPKVSLTKIDTSPILIIGVTKDPATPYKWAKTLAAAFTNSQLITLNGEGHTGHGRGNKCVDTAVDTYFLTGKSSPGSLICSQSGN